LSEYGRGIPEVGQWIEGRKTRNGKFGRRGLKRMGWDGTEMEFQK